MFRVARPFLAIVLLLALALPSGAAQNFQLTVLHTNDLHGMIEPLDYADGQGYFGHSQANIGGLARRASLISRLRGAVGHPVVVVDTGDAFADGPWSQKLYGVPEIEAMNQMGYDAFGVGNNEFQATLGPDAQDRMLLLIRRSRFPWLAANLTVGETGVPVEGIRPFVVRTFNGVRVAFLGLIPRRVANYPWLKGWTTSDPIAAAQRWVPIARREADVVIVMAHLGTETGKDLIARVPGIEAMIGGDSHTFTSEVIRCKSPSGVEVPYVQAGEMGVVLGRLDLTFAYDGKWRLMLAEEKLLPITRDLPEDPMVKQLLDRYLRPVPVGLLPLSPALAPS